MMYSMMTCLEGDEYLEAGNNAHLGRVLWYCIKESGTDGKDTKRPVRKRKLTYMQSCMVTFPLMTLNFRGLTCFSKANSIMYTTSTRKNGRLRTTVVKILTSSGSARYRRAAIMVVAQIKTTKQQQYRTMPAFVDSVAAKVYVSRESGSIPPATIRMREMMRGIYRSSRTHCIRRPFGPDVILRTLAVDMKRGVKLISVRMATPVSSVVLESLVSGYNTVAARSSATCLR